MKKDKIKIIFASILLISMIGFMWSYVHAAEETYPPLCFPEGSLTYTAFYEAGTDDYRMIMSKNPIKYENGNLTVNAYTRMLKWENGKWMIKDAKITGNFSAVSVYYASSNLINTNGLTTFDIADNARIALWKKMFVPQIDIDRTWSNQVYPITFKILGYDKDFNKFVTIYGNRWYTYTHGTSNQIIDQGFGISSWWNGATQWTDYYANSGFSSQLWLYEANPKYIILTTNVNRNDYIRTEYNITYDTPPMPTLPPLPLYDVLYAEGVPDDFYIAVVEWVQCQPIYIGAFLSLTLAVFLMREILMDGIRRIVRSIL